MAPAGVALRRAAGAGALAAGVGAVHRGLHLPRPPRPARDDPSVLAAVLAAVDRLLAGDSRLRAGELAQGRTDPGHAALVPAGGGCGRRSGVVARAVAALPGRAPVVARRRARVLVGLAGPRPAGLARPRQRHAAAAAAEIVSARTPAERRQRVQALPPLREPDARAIEAFLDAAWAEGGLSRQTLASYRRD